APKPAAHEVHTHEARDEEVDVAAARLGDVPVAFRPGVPPRLPALHDLADAVASQCAARLRWVVEVLVSLRGRHDDERNVAALEPCLASVRLGQPGGHAVGP